jgi:hypothetical protein
MIVRCPVCGYDNTFAQPNQYHAGFANQGFLYNDAGTLSLVWSSFDPAYERIVGPHHPWMLSVEQRRAFEAILPAAPTGGKWRFENPARCGKCQGAIADPISAESIYYLEYPGSILLDESPSSPGLEAYIRDHSVAT